MTSLSRRACAALAAIVLGGSTAAAILTASAAPPSGMPAITGGMSHGGTLADGNPIPPLPPPDS